MNNNVKFIHFPGLDWIIVRSIIDVKKSLYIFIPKDNILENIKLYLEQKHRFPYLVFTDEDLENGNFKRSLINLDRSVYYFCDILFDNSDQRLVSYMEIHQLFANLGLKNKIVKI